MTATKPTRGRSADLARSINNVNKSSIKISPTLLAAAAVNFNDEAQWIGHFFVGWLNEDLEMRNGRHFNELGCLDPRRITMNSCEALIVCD